MTASVLITGARGFIGRNLAVRLRETGTHFLEVDRENTDADLVEALKLSDVIFHLAGVNRPETEAEFQSGNADFTQHLTDLLRELNRRPHVVMSSSTQALLDNPYGRSKRAGEEALLHWARETGGRATVFRLKNVFGKWCRPNYNSAVATFCHNIARDLPITIRDHAYELDLMHVDDVVTAFMEVAAGEILVEEDGIAFDHIPFHSISLGSLAQRLQAFRDVQRSLVVPDLSERFDRQLYGTYLSYLEPERWAYSLERRADARGDLAEFIKSQWFGQVFVSRTRPGITRGGHYHHSKAEKFLVLTGEGLIRFRAIEGGHVINVRVRGEDYRVVEIPPGYAHSITNVGETEMVTLFWASEVFDPQRPDTVWMPTH